MVNQPPLQVQHTQNSVLKIFIWFVILFYEFLPCCVIIFCLISMFRVVYKHNRAADILTRQLRFNYHVSYKSYEKSGVILMTIVSGFFLAYISLNIRCGILYILDKWCLDWPYKIPTFVCNSAVNPLAYAFFKRDIKKEITKLMYKLTKHHRSKIHRWNGIVQNEA